MIVKGKNGEVSRNLNDPKIRISIGQKEIVFMAMPATQMEKKKIGSMMAHVKNMFRGVQVGINYKLKICSGHFPMNVSSSGKQFIVKNFLGEKVPRVLELSEKVKIKVEGDHITVDGNDKELVSQTAASIETLTRRV